MDLCRRCGQPIYRHQARAFPVRGYEVTRSGGGQNHVLFKERIDGWVWHAKPCFEDLMRQRKGGGHEQLAMIDAPPKPKAKRKATNL